MSKKWRRRLPLALVLLIWVAAVGPLGQYTGRLGEVQSTDSTSFLPATAESTRVAELRKGFEDRSTVPAVVVWESADEIGPDDEKRAAAAIDRVRREGIAAETPSPPLRSDDGRALQSVIPLAADLDDPPVDRIRELAAVPGLKVYVTGSAAVSADLSKAFAGIDGLLLLVALGVVLLILLLVYRSVLLPLVVIVTAVLALALASALVYLLADRGVLTLDGQTQGIMFILVVGAATDYALLLAVRYREELAEADKWPALKRAWRASLAPITASAFTVAAGLLTLLLSDLNSNRSLGPVAAIGVGCALLAVLTFLPAALALLGRAAYWPSRRLDRGHKVWDRLAGMISRHPRRTWMTTALALGVLAVFMPTLKADGIAQSDVFLNKEPSIVGQEALQRHFPSGSGNPAVVLVESGSLQKAAQTAQSVEGVDSVRPVADPSGRPKIVDGRAMLQATFTDAPDSAAAMDTVAGLRDALHPLPGADALVGGYTASQYDTQVTAEHDRTLIIPVALLVILAILGVLLRAMTAPVVLILTVVLSFAATLGVAALMFNHVFDFPGSDPSVPLFGFVFLVALGVDYNIFLMTRVREEALEHGAREGVLRGLVATGGVITSAGVVLAATFGALAVLPLVFLVQLAFIVAFGVLLDALVVRSLLVPALAYDLGPKMWWPTRNKIRP
ncbi:MMPL family transporter [Actinocorallia populi]|uniref:MMPL family transporter n=1 Tax=Actinocorallia populi TaxID=2079200 RepID=UPI000D0879B2|nr:MMPL family transporter [Actinocorallia populi]